MQRWGPIFPDTLDYSINLQSAFPLFVRIYNYVHRRRHVSADSSSACHTFSCSSLWVSTDRLYILTCAGRIWYLFMRKGSKPVGAFQTTTLTTDFPNLESSLLLSNTTAFKSQESRGWWSRKIYQSFTKHCFLT